MRSKFLVASAGKEMRGHENLNYKSPLLKKSNYVNPIKNWTVKKKTVSVAPRSAAPQSANMQRSLGRPSFISR